MDRVGGESVWLTWFAAAVCRSFASLAGEDGQRYLKEAAALTAAAEGAWDGQWYLRGRFADGSPLGGAESPACRLDSLSQSFAALCPGADPEHVRQALDAAVEQLFLRPHSIVQLFTPAFFRRGAGPGLYPKLRPRLPGKRRTVHPRRHLACHGLPAPGAYKGRGGHTPLPAAQGPGDAGL